jgi:hypothetical protein
MKIDKIKTDKEKELQSIRAAERYAIEKTNQDKNQSRTV